MSAEQGLNVGQRVADYVVRRLLGEGGMAHVYLAEHVETGVQVAIKAVAAHLTRVPQAVARFEAEARTVMRIDHPNVIKVFDFGRLSDGTMYQVLELLQGRELWALMQRRPKRSPWEVHPYLQQICAGLQAAHDRDVIHRDLKPENIFVMDGYPLRVKLLDFGIAKLLDPDEWVQLTTTGTVIGTPLYISPEQAMGDKSLIGPRTDIYSLGVILYHLLCGQPPFPFESVGKLLAQHIQEIPPPLLHQAPDVPPGIAQLVHRCMEKEPSRRPASASELIAAYAEALSQADGGPVRDTMIESVQEPTTDELTRPHPSAPASSTELYASDGEQLSFSPEAPALPDTAVDTIPPWMRMETHASGGAALPAARPARTVAMTDGSDDDEPTAVSHPPLTDDLEDEPTDELRRRSRRRSLERADEDSERTVQMRPRVVSQPGQQADPDAATMAVAGIAPAAFDHQAGESVSSELASLAEQASQHRRSGERRAPTAQAVQSLPPPGANAATGEPGLLQRLLRQPLLVVGLCVMALALSALVFLLVLRG